MSEKVDTNISFISTVALENAGPFPTFKEALRDFVHRMKTDPRAHSMQIVETACWIQRNDLASSIPLGFYDARDFGYKTGLLIGEHAEFNDDAPEPGTRLLNELYIACAIGLGNAENFIKRLPAHSTA